jgi:hypothetical protein
MRRYDFMKFVECNVTIAIFIKELERNLTNYSMNQERLMHTLVKAHPLWTSTMRRNNIRGTTHSRHGRCPLTENTFVIAPHPPIGETQKQEGRKEQYLVQGDISVEHIRNNAIEKVIVRH